jgi:surface antigen
MMRASHWPVVAVLVACLTGCHAIYGKHEAAPPVVAEVPPDNPGTNAGAAITTEAISPPEAPPVGSGTTVGTFGSAAAEGSAGSTQPGAGIATTPIAATLAGSYFGDHLGSRFDDNARQAAAAAEQQALAANVPADWRDPQSDTSGRVRPLRSFVDAAGRTCREYSQTVSIAGQRRGDTGIACRQSDGSWRLVGG